MASAPNKRPSDETNAQTPFRQPGALAVGIARVAALTGLIISAYLVRVASLGDKVAGCGAATPFDCNELLDGHWSRWFNLPVALPAALVYALALLALFAIRRERFSRLQRLGWQVLLVISTTVVAAACWFLGLQLLAQRFCVYCLAAHGCGLVLAAFVLWYAPIGWRPQAASAGTMEPKRALGLLAIGLVCSCLLMAGQWLAASSPRDMRVVRLIGSSGSSMVLDVRDYPRLGKVDAKYVVVELYNYNCAHCRVMHNYLEQACRRYGDQLAILALVVPLHPGCNRYMTEFRPGSEHACDYARLALAVWEARPGEFEGFHRWLMASAPGMEDVKRRAEELLGAAAVATALTDPRLDRRIAKHVSIYAAYGGGQLPKLVHGPHITEGEPADAQQLFHFLEKDVGLPSGDHDSIKGNESQGK